MENKRIVVLDGFTTDQGDSSMWDELLTLGDVKIFERTSPEQTQEHCGDAEIVFTNKVPLNKNNIGAKIRYIGLLATGTNTVDLEVAKRRNIVVTNVPNYSTEAVAQLVFALLLQLTHDVAGHNADVKAGKWTNSPDFFFMNQPLMEFDGKTLVVVGSGAIGSAVTRIAKAFGMTVIASRVPGSSNSNRMSLEEALPQADIVSLHCPLTEKTRNIVDRKFLALLKSSALLINTGRGGLVCEADLIESLDQNRIGGVGLDVLSKEPPPKDHPLLNSSAEWAHKVVVTPHLAWGTTEARHRLVKIAVENLRAFLNGAPINRVA